MSVRASITIDGIAGLKPSQIRAAARVAMQAVGDRWIREFLPRHFTRYATARYHYTPRSESYRSRKRHGAIINGIQSIKEDLPLVWSGRSRERAKGARTEAKSPSSTHAYADVIIDVPALNLRFRGSQINMREELTTVLPQEAEELAARFVYVFERELDRLGRTTQRRRAA